MVDVAPCAANFRNEGVVIYWRCLFDFFFQSEFLLEKVLVAPDGTPTQSSLKITGECKQTLREARLELALGACGGKDTVPSAPPLALACPSAAVLVSVSLTVDLVPTGSQPNTLLSQAKKTISL